MSAYKFTILNGQISNVYEWEDGMWRKERLSANESWSVDGA